MTWQQQCSLHITCISYVSNERCCSKKDWQFGPTKTLALHGHIVSY